MPLHRFVFLDGLRGVAALAVVILHLTANERGDSNIVPHATLAVDFFFILSGFVIAFAYDERLRSGRLSFWSFTSARLIRLYPMLLLGLAIGATAFAIRIMTRGEWSLWPAFIEALALGLLLLPSHLIPGPGYTAAYPFNVPSWSLFFELAANCVYAGIARWMTNARLLLVTAFGACGLLFVMILYGGANVGSAWATFGLGGWRVLFAFSAGVLIYRFRDRLPGLPPLAGLVLAIGLLSLFLMPLEKSWMYDGTCIFFAFPMIIVFGAGVRVSDGVARLCLFVGRLSYPLYLLHYPAVRLSGSFLRTHSFSTPQRLLFWAMVLAFVTAISAFCLIYVDEPVRRALNRQVRRPTPPMAVTSAAKPGPRTAPG
jgi:peptidoglycan/LPS O-acetylase OafA/YrhL